MEMRDIYITLIAAVVMIIIMFFLAQVLPVKVSQAITDANVQELAVNDCKQLCNTYKSTIDMEKGSCLSDIYDMNVKDWACDLAHNPRTSADDLPENQCVMYRKGIIKHFVELDTNCDLIKYN